MFLSSNRTRTSVRSEAGAPSFGLSIRKSVAASAFDQARSSRRPSILIGSVARNARMRGTSVTDGVCPASTETRATQFASASRILFQGTNDLIIESHTLALPTLVCRGEAQPNRAVRAREQTVKCAPPEPLGL